jgi:hypothetical protein
VFSPIPLIVDLTRILTLIDVLVDLLVGQVVDVLLWEIRLQQERVQRGYSSKSPDEFDTFDEDLVVSVSPTTMGNGVRPEAHTFRS